MYQVVESSTRLPIRLRRLRRVWLIASFEVLTGRFEFYVNISAEGSQSMDEA